MASLCIFVKLMFYVNGVFGNILTVSLKKCEGGLLISG